MTQNSRPSLPRSRHSKTSLPGSAWKAWALSPGASTPIGWPRTSSSSQPNMRRAERFIHSMPPGPTLTMPTSTESSTARSLSARSSSAFSA